MNKRFLSLVVEAVEQADLYKRFQTEQSFRYNIVNKLSQNGYIVHGTNENFDYFDKEKIKGGSRAVYGYGAYFTDAAYKCEEFGVNFIFVNRRPFSFLELKQRVIDNNIFYNINKQIEKLEIDIEKLKEELYNTRNIRDYNYIDGEIEKKKQKLKEILPNTSLRTFIEQFNYFLNQNINITYRDMTKKLDNIFSNAMGYDFVSSIFLNFGYDGYHIDNEYIIFNFEKLNQNIVKDKNKLLNELISK